MIIWDIQFLLVLKPIYISFYLETVYDILFLQVCSNGHLAKKWCSQPLLNRRLHSGDLMLSAASLLSGNNFQKISDFAKVMKLPLVNISTYHRIQRTYLVPSIDQFWINHQTSTLEDYIGKDVVVLGIIFHVNMSYVL